MTLFIIAGIVILFAAFFIGYLQNENFRQRVESQLFGVSVVPEQAKGVVSYINNCIENIASDGVELLGFQGGYLDVPNSLSSREYLQPDPLSKVPYWVYGNKVVVPSPGQMESQLKSYIDRRANVECDFNAFSDYEFSSEQISTNVKISDGGILVNLDSDIDVNIKDSVYSLDDYISASIPVDLSLLYDLAVDIVNREMREGKIGRAPFELATKELIASHSKDENSRLSIPPIGKLDFSCNPKTWLMENVKENIKEILSDNMRFLRVEGAGNLDYGEDYVNLFVDDVFSSEHLDVGIDFNYNKEWPLFLDIYPRNGRVLKPDTLKIGLPFISLFCTTTYNFRYTLRYPLMVNLENDGFIFRFPIEVFILDNYAGRDIEGDVSRVSFADIESEFCNKGQRLSEDINIVTIDATNRQPLSDVQVMYVCGVNNCVIGDTKLESGEVRLNSKFPLCYNGEIRLSKEGYGEFTQELTTLNSKSTRIFGVMKPFIEKEIELRVIDLSDGITSVRELNENEIASVQFNILENGMIKNQIGVVFEGDGIEKIELLPEQEYNILINLVLNDKVVIPKGKYGEQEIPSQELENILLGGADFNAYTSEEDLMKDKIIIFALSNGIPKNYQDYIEGFDMKALSELNQDKLELRFE
ncbi:hypothetical protein HYV89_04740 [Candidatus Woesearchaeota archaeon]|nr:hypothetical protein [Candidatus Woesearchaeota archaeon]